MATSSVAINKQNPVIPGSIQEYIDDLKQDKQCKKFDLDQAQADLDKAQLEYNHALKRKTAIENFWERINQTAEVSFELYNELNSAAEIINNVGKNTGYSVQGIEILVKATHELSVCWETLQNMIKALLQAIRDALKGDKALDESTSIMKCLIDLESRIDGAAEKIKAAITATLLAYKCAILLDNRIKFDSAGEQIELSKDITGCNPVEGSSATSEKIADLDLCGILEKVNEMLESLGKAGFKVGSAPTKADMMLIGDKYYDELKVKFEAENSAYQSAKSELDEKTKQKTNTQAQYDSICDALKAAEEAKAC